MKLQRVEVTETGLPAEQGASPPPQAEPPTLQHKLYKTNVLAIYREPLVSDLEAVELSGIDITDRRQMPQLCRAIARQCCIQWGGESTMPEVVRSQDADRAAFLMLKRLGNMYEEGEKDTHEKVLDGQSRRNPGFDAYLVTLANGDTVLLDEPTERDLEAKEQAKTYMAGIVRMAASLTVEWNSKPVEWTDAYLKLRGLSIENFMRVSDALMRFRGELDELFGSSMATGDLSHERTELQQPV